MKKRKIEPKKESSQKISRRAVMKGAAALAAGTAASVVAPSKLLAAAEAQGSAAPYKAPEVLVAASPKKNIVETDSGKVFGAVTGGIVSFRGIPYGASTAGKNRFMPPVKPEPWAGARSALYWGPVAPQPFTATLDGRRGGWAHDDEAFMFDWEDGHDSEDCLRINVWTPALDNGKRPVMVWLHGGGFVGGSSQELRMYPGDNLARRGDVVAVSVNHRLGVLGYSNLMEYGDQYASSPNVGMLDLVAALQWVKTNISNFGGDPNRVLIFGQSGGGAKVSTLMGMPSAEGLFHRGVVESGSSLRQGTVERSARSVHAVLAELGLNKSNISKIQELPYQQIVEAAVHAQRVSAANRVPGSAGLGGWGPVVDGKILPRNAWDPTAPSYSAKVPLIVGNVLNEFFNAVQMEDSSVDSWSMDEVKKQLSGAGGGTGLRRGLLGSHTDHVVEVFQRSYPNATPFTAYSIIMAMASMRINALAQAERKANQGTAPAYNYWFQRQTPILDGRGRAFHCSELPFVFYNTEVCAPMTGGGPDALKLGGQMADAWINFARSGDPNHAGIPHWPAYDPKKVTTMIFDNECVVKNDPDGDIRKAIMEARA